MTKLTNREILVQRLEKSRDAKRAKWGHSSVSLGNERITHNVVPSPSWMLDYKMGTGGFPYGHLVEVFGANSLGKSSAIAYPTIANVQRQDKIPALIAAEPQFDMEWVERLGVDPELMLLQRPDHADEAFEMLHDLVYENLVDYIVLDSLGALAAATEAQEDGKKKAFGISGTVTSGLNAIMPRLWKNNIGLLILNQQRQDTKTRSMPGMMNYDSPGGEGLHHNAVIRIQLKPGANRYTDKIDGEDVLVGRELICSFRKNKMAMNSKAARFDFFYVPTEKYGYKLGVDLDEDVIRTGKVTGVLSGSNWIEHSSFPNGKLHGKVAVSKFLAENPQAAAIVRDEVLVKMQTEQVEARKRADLALVKEPEIETEETA